MHSELYHLLPLCTLQLLFNMIRGFAICKLTDYDNQFLKGFGAMYACWIATGIKKIIPPLPIRDLFVKLAKPFRAHCETRLEFLDTKSRLNAFYDYIIHIYCRLSKIVSHNPTVVMDDYPSRLSLTSS